MEDIRKGNKVTCIIITEANERVASGHLMEMLELSVLLKKEKISYTVFVNADAPEGLKNRFDCSVIEYDTDVSSDQERICKEVKIRKPELIITDLREVSNIWIKYMKNELNSKMLCIDEFGNRQLDADIIINPMIDPSFWDYQKSDGIIYTGHDYLILPDSLRVFHAKEKMIRDEIRNVCISMGGVDPHGTTVKLMKFLPERFQSITWEVVLGAGFSHYLAFADVIHNCKGRISIHQNLDNIFHLFYNADIAFTAGGNTLHELACIGTPAIVIPSMTHEINNGKMYERGGFGRCLGIATDFDEQAVADAFEEMRNRKTRQIMSRAGKKLSDGQGGERNVEIIKNLIR